MKYLVSYGTQGGEAKLIGWANDITEAVSVLAGIVGADNLAAIKPIVSGGKSKTMLWSFYSEARVKFLRIEPVAHAASSALRLNFESPAESKL